MADVKGLCKACGMCLSSKTALFQPQGWATARWAEGEQVQSQRTFSKAADGSTGWGAEVQI